MEVYEWHTRFCVGHDPHCGQLSTLTNDKNIEHGHNLCRVNNERVFRRY
jgi:hypothetical protein